MKYIYFIVQGVSGSDRKSILFKTTFCGARMINVRDIRLIRNSYNMAVYLPQLILVYDLAPGPSSLCVQGDKPNCQADQISDGANFLRQQLLQCLSEETLAIGSAFKCERGWMDGACFHGDESVARVLIMLLRRRIRCWEQRTMRT